MTGLSVMKKFRLNNIALWVVGLVFFPIAVGLLMIWPSRILKDTMKKGWKILWWAIYTPVAAWLAFTKVCCIVLLVSLALNPSGLESGISRTDVEAPAYKSADDFYRLTGVRFPELKLVDSLSYTDGGLSSNWWNEYVFVAEDELDESFFIRLEIACEEDSKHWSSVNGGAYSYFGEGGYDYVPEDKMVYEYFIYPDVTPVDRTEGDCDRMVEIEDDKWIEDWDGRFLSVNVYKDKIILRDGWLR